MRRFYTLALLSALLIPLGANAFPFVPTADPALKSTHWYQMKLGNNYLFADTLAPPGFEEMLCSSTESIDDTFLWCFVGDGTNGYKVYNKHMKRYLFLPNNFGGPDHENVVFCEDGTDGGFYLYAPSEWGNMYVIFEGKFWVTDENPAVFTINEIYDGTWKRFDANGVGYRFVQGGSSGNPNEKTNNLCDGDASTKFCGENWQAWMIMEARVPVAVSQYSIVTANDSRGQFQRALRSWTLQGSNDQQNWTTIDARVDYPMPFLDQHEEVFRVNDTNQYRYFKFITDATATTNTQMSEIWINEENHTWDETLVTDPTCGEQGSVVSRCATCNAFKTDYIAATGQHSYVDGRCTVCGLEEGVKVLLSNGQTNPHTAMAIHGYRNSDQTWPELPYSWQYLYLPNAETWADVTMPMANLGHSNGPFSELKYNSLWYGEYNCYWLRRQFYMPEVDRKATYTLRYVHDDNMVVYVNATKVLEVEGWTQSKAGDTWDDCYESIEIPSDIIYPGVNTVAVYIQQNWGGAYFDCELVMKSQPKGMRGDLNADGQVDVTDVSIAIDMVLGKMVMIAEGAQPDLNGDGQVDVSDVSAIIDIVLGKA